MNTEMLFSSRAGRYERMLKRQFDNPLFGDVKIEPFDIQQARKRDAGEVEQFINEFRDLVQQVAGLEPDADVELVLKLKEALDKSYETSAGLGGDQDEVREMIVRLLSLMMKSMWKAVGNDAQGISKLEMEEQARAAHFSMTGHPFIADLISPDSLIGEKRLLPCLFSEPADTFALAVQLFDAEQQREIYQQAEVFIKSLDSAHHRVQQAQQRLHEMAGLMEPVTLN